MARTRGDDEHEESADGPVAAAPDAGWTSVAEAAAHRNEGASDPLGLHAVAGSLLTRLGAWAALIPDRSQWRSALGRAAKIFRFPQVTAQAPASALPSPAPDPAAAPPPTLLDPVQVRARVETIMKLLPPRGDPTVRGDLQALGRLLSDKPPLDDFEAADLLHDCFPRGTRNSDSRILMAIARNLTRNFGRSGRLPITSGKAWTMIDPELFSEELAAQLAAICNFVLNWQATEREFLILEFAEVELIEYLFEALHPRRHAALLIKVMDFKVLSLRRMGLIRRIPARIRRRIQHAHGADPAVLRGYIADTMALLEYFSRPECFSAVSAAAKATRAEVEKIAAQLAGPSPVPPVAQPQESLHPLMRGLGVPAESRQLAMAEPAPPRQVTPPVAPSRRRFTKKQKTEAVMRLFQGEELEWVAISLGISPGLLTRWQQAFLNGGSAALALPAKARDSREPSVDDLKDKLHSLIKTVELLSSQMAQIPAQSKLAIALPPPEPVAQAPTLALPSPPTPTPPTPTPPTPTPPRPSPPKNTRFAKKRS